MPEPEVRAMTPAERMQCHAMGEDLLELLNGYFRNESKTQVISLTSLSFACARVLYEQSGDRPNREDVLDWFLESVRLYWNVGKSDGDIVSGD